MEILWSFHIHLLHPKLVHFPIALFISAMGMEILSLILKKDHLHRTALHMYVLATVITPLIFLTGWQEAEHLHLHHPILYAHRNYALATLVVSWAGLGLMWVRRNDVPAARVTFRCACWLCAGLVLAAAYFGGEMVYDYGIGVAR